MKHRNLAFFFADVYEKRWPKKSWTNAFTIAKELKTDKNSWVVGFRRFVYDPEYGKKYLDKGWVYFKGKTFTNNEILSGDAKKECPEMLLTDTAISNIKNNHFDCLYIAEHNKIWPFNKEDVLI